MSDEFVKILQGRGLRETVESVVIAIVLAFLFRTFVAEPFVIPTGSMAPTLQGRHQQVTCPVCEFSYRVGASREIDSGSNTWMADNYVGRCPQCGFLACTNPALGNRLAKSEPGKKLFTTLALDRAEHVKSRNGDRILVSKSAYEFNSPERWDVFVFHFPGEAVRNYIKRLVGLPGETLRLKYGDVFHTENLDADASTPLSDFDIVRKPAATILNMMQLVYDNDYAATPGVVEFMTDRGWLPRWSDEQGRWQSQDNTKSFSVDSADGVAWLRYQHRLPTADDWRRLAENSPAADGELVEPIENRPQLITDSYAYNSGVAVGKVSGMQLPRFMPARSNSLGLNWVGDLVIDCQLESRDGNGKAVLELVEGGIRFQCEIDFATGSATLKIVDPNNQLLSFNDEASPGKLPQAAAVFQGAGRHQLTFANVDDQLHVWMDGEPVTFDSDTSYPRLANTAPTTLDLTPVRIGASGASLKIDEIKLYRDVYYIASDHNRDLDTDRPHLFCDLKYSTLNDYQKPVAGLRNQGNWQAHAEFERNRARFFSDPREWQAMPSDWPGTRSQWRGAYHDTYDVTYTLEDFPEDPANDQFFALGDNSPQSQDSRLWWQETGIGHYVERKLIIGRAMLIYWPLGHVKFIR